MNAKKVEGSFIRAVRKAYRATDVYKFQQLAREESTWLRRRSIAENNLASVRRRINEFASELACRELGTKP